MSTVLVTGGTGLLGRTVAAQLTDAGHHVRVMSRRPDPANPAEVAVADLGTGAGLHDAVAGVTAIIHAASDPRSVEAVDVAGTVRLIDAARAAGQPHLIHVSIVGVDRIPYPYYRAKLRAEQAVAHAGLPWTVLRTTQFHQFAAYLMSQLGRVPGIVPVPRDWRIQPVDPAEVATHLVAAVDAGPQGHLPDLGGPQIFPIAELARTYLTATADRRRIVAVPVPGRLSAAFRAGANLAPNNRGGITWSQFLESKTTVTIGTEYQR